VALTRTTDVFVGLEERAKFANDLYASLFVSIHNNSMTAGYKGTMMLYYPTSTTGKAYAQIMLNNMVRDLNTNNLGLSARGDLVVLKKTTMPAVLAEIACMSDPDDMALLNTTEFIQKAAESLANSIIQILNSQS
jgi:N-acetylmuramoyl-L-alanine amidase